jgi:predicted ribosome quality control (RQC) complex YloA/Tae2 family protein
VVIRNAGRKVPQNVLEQAASWAAWYSKSKNESLSPVIYTPRKFVRKPKGAKPGAVLVEKEQVIMVPPMPPMLPNQ